MYEDNTTEDGIVLTDAMSEKVENIDWDAVLRDFARLQDPAPLSDEDIRELVFLQRLDVGNELTTAL